MEVVLRNPGIRLRGALGRARIWLGGKLTVLAGTVASAIVDLGLAIAPEISTAPQPRGRPWLGLLIVALLALGLVAAGDVGLVLVREALPHREVTP